MARYIDIEELSARMYREAFEKDSDMQKWDGGCWIRYKLFEQCRDATPAADVAPVRHGRWIEDGYYDYEIVCSQCGAEALRNKYNGEYYKSDFCPSCGAMMGVDE